jgi:hypothetical protein
MSIARYEKRMMGWLIDKLIFPCCPRGRFHGRNSLFSQGFSLFLEILIAASRATSSTSFLFALYLFSAMAIPWDGDLRNPDLPRDERSRIRFKEAFLKALMTGFTAMDLINSIYMLSSHTERSVFDRLTNTLVIDVRAER